jgi:SAM-dependent methyltransferase
METAENTEVSLSWYKIQRIVIDTTQSITELCRLGELFGADKSPLNGNGGHRHPYTSVYSMLLSPLRNKPIQFAEIGIAYGASVGMWMNFFTKARLCFFDRDENFLKRIRQENGEPYLGLMDVAVDGDITRALTDASGQFDVILDDSSHDFDHQIRIAKEAFPFIKPGGYLLIEDIFRSRKEVDYEIALDEILAQCSMAYFVVCNHEERYSPGWNNDKILVLVKA